MTNCEDEEPAEKMQINLGRGPGGANENCMRKKVDKVPITGSENIESETLQFVEGFMDHAGPSYSHFGQGTGCVDTSIHSIRQRTRHFSWDP